MTTPSNGSKEIDKREIYGTWLEGREQDRKLMLQVARKALDIDEDVNVNAPKTINHYHAPEPKGLGTLGRLAVGAGLLATGAGIPVGASFIADAIKNIKPPAPVTGPDVDRDWGIRILPDDKP